MPPSPKYKKNREQKLVRIVYEVPAEEAQAIDDWGVAAGMPSRKAAMQKLIADGLKANRLKAPKE